MRIFLRVRHRQFQQKAIKPKGRRPSRMGGGGRLGVGLTDKGLLDPLQHFSCLVQCQLCPTGHSFT